MSIASRSLPARLAATLLLAIAAGPAAAACVSEQNFTLQPGWNAIYVGVDPQVKELATVFAGLPIASVWRWRADEGGARFIADPAEGLDPLTGWFGWFPAGKPEAFLSNLYQLEPNTAYLVKLEGAQSRQFSVGGTPIYTAKHWQPDAYTLTGVTADSSNPPSFAEYFAGSGAHQGQPIYKLGTDGRWTLVTSPSSETLSPNRAYWFRTRGNSDWSGPLRAVLESGESLEFGGALERVQLVLRNLTGANGSFTINRLGGSTLPLAYAVTEPDGDVVFPRLENQLVLPAPAGSDTFLTLAPKRGEFTQNRHVQNFAITDEQGNCVLLAAGADAAQPLVSARGAAVPAPHAGLWLGEVSVDAVSQAQSGHFEPAATDINGDGVVNALDRRYVPDVPSSTPAPAQRTFTFRVLMHVDASGQARLLKDVIQMWQDGTTQPSASDPSLNEIAQPGRFVLVTDKARLSQFSGSTVRDNVSVGQRLSTVGYDFPGDTLAMVGTFGPGTVLSADLQIAADFPTNPFLHRYHPDHNNLDEQSLPLPPQRSEAYALRRLQQFTFLAQQPDGGSSPEWGSDLVGGTFREEISGLHRLPIFVSGRFSLNRVSPVASLDQ
jgi:hypothetical protein